MSKSPFQRSTLALSIAVIAGIQSLSSTVVAQEAIIEEGAVEEVMVRGIKSSLVNAIEIKRSNVGVMDAISAEDFGKFPDGNVAESLARAPGIAIDRSNVEGQRIAVRGFGPEFNLVTLNGRQMPTVKGRNNEGGRSFNFGDIASPGISSLEIFKSSNTSLPSGGIGSTVNMVTTKPLKIDGTKRFLGVSYVEDTTSSVSDTPIEAEVLFATNQEWWGFALSGAYHERTNRETGTRESNWFTTDVLALSEGYSRVDPSNTAFENSNQRADGNTFYQEPSAYLIKDNDRTRANIQATLQFMMGDSVTATVDYTYSGVDFESEGMLFGSWLGGWDTESALINSNGVFTDVTVGNRSYDHTAIWAETESKNKSAGFNLLWEPNDQLSLEFDYHNSTAELSGNIFDNEAGFSTDTRTTVTSTNGGASGINTFSYADTFGPENMQGTSLFLREAFQKNEINQFQVKGIWNADSGILSSVEFGISTTENQYTNQDMEANFGSQSPSVDDFDDAMFELTRLDSDFMNSFNPNLGTDYYFRVDPQTALTAFAAANQEAGLVDGTDGTVCCTAGGLDSNDRVKEELDSAFVQFNFDTELMDRPLRMTAGLRYEKSKTESIAYYSAPSLIRWDMIDGLIGVTGDPTDTSRSGSNSTVLPNLVAAWEFADDQVLRASWGKSIARPSLGELTSQLDVGNQDFFNLTAEGGNPNLETLKSENFDIAYENYYAEGSYFSVNYFHKKISDFIGSQTVNDQPLDSLTDPSQTAIALAARECVQAWVDAGRPDPGFPGEEGATGDCVSQQALWAQPWMNDQQHMGWVALALSRGNDVTNGFPFGVCDFDGWWRCEPGYIDATAGDPLAAFDITQPFNMNNGSVSGIELNWQHLFNNTPFGMQFNYTFVSGGDVEPDADIVGDQFILPGFGDSGNLSFFYEDDRHTLRLALNYRAETAQGFANYNQPVFVEERQQYDISYQFRATENFTFFVDAMNITDEETRLYVRYPEMLFLAQDHGPVYKFGMRANF